MASFTLFNRECDIKDRGAKALQAGIIFSMALVVLGVGLGLFYYDRSTSTANSSAAAKKEHRIKLAFEILLFVISGLMSACGLGVLLKPNKSEEQKRIETPPLILLYGGGTEAKDISDIEAGVPSTENARLVSHVPGYGS